jgi:hypothetical protein
MSIAGALAFPKEPQDSCGPSGRRSQPAGKSPPFRESVIYGCPGGSGKPGRPTGKFVALRLKALNGGLASGKGGLKKSEKPAVIVIKNRINLMIVKKPS